MKNAQNLSASALSADANEKAVKLVQLLSERGWHISFAESCTGGKAAAGIVDVASASAVFEVSFVTYANESKIKFLGVSADAVSRHGVVSEEVALEMATGAANRSGAEVAVGISGIAGPSGATDTKPVGMVCFGFSVDGKAFSKTVNFGNIGRNRVREKSVAFVYDTLIDILEK